MKTIRIDLTDRRKFKGLQQAVQFSDLYMLLDGLWDVLKPKNGKTQLVILTLRDKEAASNLHTACRRYAQFETIYWPAELNQGFTFKPVWPGFQVKVFWVDGIRKIRKPAGVRTLVGFQLP